MIIKKFLAESLEEIQKNIEQELGNQAIVLTTRRIKAPGIRGFLGKTLYEVTAGAESGKDLVEENRDLSEEILKENLKQMKEFVHDMNQASHLGEEFMYNEDQEQNYDKISLSPQAKQELSSARQSGQKVATSTSLYSPMGKLSARSGMTAALEPSLHVTQVDPKEILEELKRSVNIRKEPVSDLKRLTKDLVDYFKIAEEVVHQVEEDHDSSQPQVHLHHSVQEDEPEKKWDVEEESELHEFLIEKGITHNLAVDIERSIEKNLRLQEGTFQDEHKQRLNLLNQEVSHRLYLHGPILLREQPTLVALIGPRGVGKTTTAFKLAAQYVLAGKKVMVISLDKNRSHSNAQISAFTNQYGVLFKEAEGYQQCMDLIQTHEVELAILDTPGCNQYDAIELNGLKAMLQQFHHLHVHSVVSACMKDVDVLSTMRYLSKLGTESVIVTKLDETISLGLLVNMSHKHMLPISYISYGPHFQKDFIVASPKEVTRKILMEHNQKEYQALRHLAHN